MSGRYTYQAEVRHAGLNKYRVVKAGSRYELAQKVASIQTQWDEQWRKKCETENKKTEKEQILRNHEVAQSYADNRTREAEKLQENLDSILVNSLYPIPLNVEKYKDYSDYPDFPPIEPERPIVGREPLRTDSKYNLKTPLLVKLSKKKNEEFQAMLENAYQRDIVKWGQEKKEKDLLNEKVIEEYNSKLEQWKNDRDTFQEEQLAKNNDVDKFMKDYMAGDGEAIVRYYTSVIDEIPMLLEYDRQAEAEYTQENKMLIIDILLPIIEDIPNLKKVTYVKSRGEFKESFQTDVYMKKKYDSIIYQIVLQTLNYIFKLDGGYDFIDVIVLNGKISTIDKTTGKNIEPYVLSINVSKSEFNELNLSAIDPKAWFKSAKGISASTLADITPVAPVVVMSRDDDRFVEGYDVTGRLDESINLAAINWQDFEHLIREIFAKEFSSNGGEVKITQASRDGGVDAIAFDPDPIRGGKIVIQAKRYTNVVGVSAVRDLYGTVMNEGATKGILVTTSNYGNDAYQFANGKPLTLMNGANLLYLLEKHGHKAKIDLKEAKQLLVNC
ncbi:restriction endonuclease [Anaerobium acetethylicum]|uniref:Restriction system protein n=1 Tax=Anaerobium acetethylicum TaxID=1619234 RepID=A0A1D3TUG7_9FIRM|nr:restriction endonuclease [Anaerobium acetethylicum]SCP97669.1 restriction system protein [Anaerobium acetethylicum]